MIQYCYYYYYYFDDIQRIKECLQHDKGIAWGECGLDYSHLKHATKEEQKVYL